VYCKGPASNFLTTTSRACGSRRNNARSLAVLPVPINNRTIRRKNVRAWLITWEGDHGREDNIAMLLHPETAESRVAHLLGLLSANTLGTLEDRLAYVMERDPIDHPHRPRRGGPDGRERDGHFTCGANPYLYARRVEAITIEKTDGGETIRWREIEGLPG
jgi:hypothetical protein